MGKKKRSFIDKSKSVTFQVVHRSQRDPSLADENASKLVLKPVVPSYNLLKKGKVSDVPGVDYDFEEISDEDGEEDDDDEDWDGEDDGLDGVFEDDDPIDGTDAQSDGSGSKAKAGKGKSAGSVPGKTTKKSVEPVEVKEDPTMHGIFFDDFKDYDYMKHLKPVGEDPTAVLLDAKNALKKPKFGINFVDDAASVAMSEVPRRKVQFDIPTEVLASEYEDRVGMLNRGATVDVLDVEPEMREVIYALEDEEYVEEDLDDFFAALDADEIPEDLDILPDGEYEARKAAEGGQARQAVQDDDDEYEEEEDEEQAEWYKEYQK
ncbi:hypothetical protein HDU76_005779 [Blyttiomyces sp. JEL0837]|nr:hypothetical protein HDU76_005779 [Blyttiomyces sp. JEL0837]